MSIAFENQRRMDRLCAYGADIEGINDRFMNDNELYFSCLDMLLNDENLPHLGEALARGDCEAAFEAAHSLKGVIGNMGLTPLYKLITQAVEPLRKNSMEGVLPIYQQIVHEFSVVQSLL